MLLNSVILRDHHPILSPTSQLKSPRPREPGAGCVACSVTFTTLLASSFESLLPQDWLNIEPQGWSHLSSSPLFPPQILHFKNKWARSMTRESLVDGNIHFTYFKISCHVKPKKSPLNSSHWSLSWIFFRFSRNLFCVALFFSPLCGPNSTWHYLDIEHFLQIKEKVTSGNSPVQVYWRLDDATNH